MSELPAKRARVESQLEALSHLTVVVSDTWEIDTIKAYNPQDATTNPSLIFKAAELPQYKSVVEDAIAYGSKHSAGLTYEETLALTMDRLAVNFGAEILKIVPGYVSTEVDARLSFDTDATLLRARRIIEIYHELGIDKSRVLIKVRSQN